MCLTKTHSLPKLAKKDIIVYKVLHNDNYFYHTPFFYSKVQIGETYKSKRNPWRALFETTVTSEGIHSIVSLSGAELLLKNLERYGMYKKPLVIVQCIIPKGSRYYIGSDDDVASSKLKYEKIIPGYILSKKL